MGEKSAKSAEPKPHTLLDALREFIREESDGASGSDREQALAAEPTRAEAVRIVIFAVNAVLLFGLVPESVLDNRVVDFGMKLIPAILGGILIAYFERARQLLIRFSRRSVFNKSMLAVLVMLSIVHGGLLLGQLPLFSLPIALEPEVGVVLRLDGAVVTPRRFEGHTIIDHVSLRPYEITIEHGDSGQDTLQLLASDVFFGSLAGFPLIGAFGSDELLLTADYEVRIITEPGGAWLQVYGTFPKLFLRRMKQHAYERDGRMYLQFDIREDLATSKVHLPPGMYRFELQKVGEECRKVSPAVVSTKRQNAIEFSRLECMT